MRGSKWSWPVACPLAVSRCEGKFYQARYRKFPKEKEALQEYFPALCLCSTPSSAGAAGTVDNRKPDTTTPTTPGSRSETAAWIQKWF
jgi:hypothetical protein